MRIIFMLFQLKLLNCGQAVSQRKLTQSEMQSLQETLRADYVNGNIRLREGEYQFDLAKTIASFQLELYFPDVKEIIEKGYGEGKRDDTQFIRKIQTILKKMEKSNVVKILPKRKPWELQRYALSSLKFRDSAKDLVIFATDQQIKQAQDLLHSTLNQGAPAAKLGYNKIRISILVLMIVASYAAILWDLVQSVIDPLIFIPAFSIAVACSILLGKMLSRD